MKATQIPIKSPCEADWDSMSGDAARRFCGDCQKHVQNISEMTRDDAQSLLKGAFGRDVCIRYYLDNDDNVIFQPPQTRLNAQWLGARHLLAASALMIPLLGVPASVAAQESNVHVEVEAEKPVKCEESKDNSWATNLVQRAMALMREEAANPTVFKPENQPKTKAKKKVKKRRRARMGGPVLMGMF